MMIARSDSRSHNQKSGWSAGKRSIGGAVMVLVFVFLAGCSQIKPVGLVNRETSISVHKAIVFFADGLSRDVYRELLASGQLPNIEKYLVRRGTSVDNAVTVFPSITYAVNTSFVTGL